MSLPTPTVLRDGSFGLHHTPSGPTRGLAAVICPTIGYEAVCSHRALRVLAERLAAAGVAALRVDYHGTGDAGGDDRDPGRLAAWLGSIDAAIDVAKLSSGADRVLLFGLRLGANLAGLAAARRSDVASVALFAPCTSGKSFVRETRAFRLLAAASEGLGVPAESDDLDAAGYVLTHETLAALSKELVWPKTRLAPKVLLLERDDAPTDPRLTTTLRAAPDAAVEIASLPGYAAMMVDPHRTVVPTAIIERVAGWALEQAGDAPSGTPAPLPAATIAGDGYEERARWLGDERRKLFGVVSEPKARARANVVLLNPGSVHHIGSNRMHVRWARAWAAEGLRVVRVDVGGIGESPAAPGEPENATYSKSAVPDVLRILRALPTTEPIVLVGLCSGAYAAYHTALSGESGATPPRGVVLINPQTFHFKEGDSLDVSPLAEARRYKSSLFDKDKWIRLLGGRVDVRNLLRVVASRAALEVRTRVDKRLGGPDVARELTAIVRRGIDVLLVYSATDPGLDYLTMHAKSALAELRQGPGFKLDLVQEADHTFTPIDSQRRLFAMLTAHLERLVPPR